MNKIQEIINFLIQEKPVFFKIYLLFQKFQETNYNFKLNVLYLNKNDLMEINTLLRQIKNPPFQIQVFNKLLRKYDFNLKTKILFIKQELLKNDDTHKTFEQQIKERVFRDLQFIDFSK